MDREQFKPPLEGVKQHFVIEDGEQHWNFMSSDLNYPGLHTVIRAEEDQQANRQVYLDWHDILNNPGEARMFLIDWENDEKKLEADMQFETTKFWAKVVDIYNGMMANNPSAKLTEAEVRTMLSEHHLPRPLHIFLDTAGSKSERMSAIIAPLAEVMNQTASKLGEKVVSWDDLVAVAQRATDPDLWKTIRAKKIESAT